MIFYRHGSEDSLDIDVFYIFEQMPSFRECQEFCSNKDENRNIIVIKDGIVVDCFKGTPDEINNGLLNTYKLHKQKYDLIVERPVHRDILIKMIRAVRCFISHCSRTKYRSIVKETLKSPYWSKKIEILKSIDFCSIDDYGKNGSKEDIYKIFAFQIGQTMGLLSGKELYTKSTIASTYPLLTDYLYREKNISPEILFDCFYTLIDSIEDFDFIEKDGLVTFSSFNKTINLLKEEYVN